MKLKGKVKRKEKKNLGKHCRTLTCFVLPSQKSDDLRVPVSERSGVTGHWPAQPKWGPHWFGLVCQKDMLLVFIVTSPPPGFLS
jgi:hypothetical protein